MTADEALRHWDLGAVASVEEVTSGSVNDVLRVTCERGVFYLRRYRLADEAAVAREHALIDHVARAGLPAVTPAASTRGCTAVLIDGKPWALYPAAEGIQIAKSELAPEQAVQAGEMLGRLHQVMAELPDVGYRKFQLRWPAEAWIERLAVIADAVRARDPLAPADARVLERLVQQRAWLSDARCVHRYQPAFSAQVTHGDYQHANLFFAGDAVTGVIDWEQALFMPRAYEVVRAAAYMLDMRPEPTRAFLAAYRSITGIDDEELDDGARAWGCMSDHYVWALEEVYLHGNERARRFIPDGFQPFHLAWAQVRSE